MAKSKITPFLRDELSFTLRSDGRLQTKIKLPTMRKPKYFYGHTQAEIYLKISEYITTNEKGRFINEICDEWQEEHYEEISYNTGRSYLAPLKLIKEEYGNLRATEVDAKELNIFVRRYAKRGYKKKTVKNLMSVMRMVFNHAVLMGDLETSPMEATRLPSGLESGHREMPTDEDIEIIKKSVDLPFGLFPYLILYTGCRPGEALAIDGRCVDKKNNEIIIENSIYYIGNTPHLKSTKTDNGIRHTVLLDRLAEKLPDNIDGYLFGGEKPLSKKAYNYRWRKYKELTGISFTPYQLRHAFATMLYEADVDEKEAQRLMGHAQISTTRDIYTHIRQKKKESTFEKLNNADY